MQITSLCYIEKGNTVLMLYRNKKKNDVNQGKWIGVGGKLETGETPETCMLREVKEETGLRLLSWRKRGTVDFESESWTERMYLFTAVQFEGELSACDEGELRWIQKERIQSLSLWEGDRVFLRLLAEDAPYFHLLLKYDGERLISAMLNGEALDI